MITIDKEKMKQMLDDILIPVVEKHSKILDEINEKRPDYLIGIELNLISHKGVKTNDRSYLPYPTH